MIYYSSSSYSRRNYARFRSSLAMDRFVAGAKVSGSSDLRWARAWLLAVHGGPERDDPIIIPQKVCT